MNSSKRLQEYELHVLEARGQFLDDELKKHEQACAQITNELAVNKEAIAHIKEELANA